MDAPVVVTVPCRTEFVAVLRLVTASVAARMDLPYDTIDDLCLAVDEACAHLLATGAPASALNLAIGTANGGLEVVVGLDADTEAWPPAGIENGFSWQVLSALTDRVEFGRHGEGVELRMWKAAERSA